MYQPSTLRRKYVYTDVDTIIVIMALIVAIAFTVEQ